MRLYSISYCTTKNDNGHCATFRTREAAEACRASLIADGCWRVSGVW